MGECGRGVWMSVGERLPGVLEKELGGELGRLMGDRREKNFPPIRGELPGLENGLKLIMDLLWWLSSS